MDLETAAWDTALSTILRERAAYLERHGQRVNWGGNQLEALLARIAELERQNAENADTQRPD